ncbi:uncharacterized protein LOC124262420 [Haliotis rubra]|uniref:uncharacterized protein LOC124262420 n=1 Tax=Haliotis rubra TaxID=36100 RepID=UPI001EE4FC2A|nr:uncharacterized protein LOC124262420 [Haliotis rubra]
MNWNMDLKLITKGGTVPYQATGQVLFESEIHNQENSYFCAARMELELVSCESDLDLLPRVPDTVTSTTRSSLEQTSDKVGSAIDLRSVTTKSSLNLTSDTDGSAINLSPDTPGSAGTPNVTGSAIHIRSVTTGSATDLTSDTDGSAIDLTSDTDGSTTDLTLCMRGSHLSVFSSQYKNAGTLPNPNKDSNGRPQCRKRQ